MNVPHFFRSRANRMRLGLSLLLAASLLRWLPRFGVVLPAAPGDTLLGLLYGGAIGFLLLSLGRSRPADGEDGAAGRRPR